jgi:hypothetical protein
MREKYLLNCSGFAMRTYAAPAAAFAAPGADSYEDSPLEPASLNANQLPVMADSVDGEEHINEPKVSLRSFFPETWLFSLEIYLGSGLER